jgi:hypothetical protein
LFFIAGGIGLVSLIAAVSFPHLARAITVFTCALFIISTIAFLGYIIFAVIVTVIYVFVSSMRTARLFQLNKLFKILNISLALPVGIPLFFIIIYGAGVIIIMPFCWLPDYFFFIVLVLAFLLWVVWYVIATMPRLSELKGKMTRGSGNIRDTALVIIISFGAFEFFSMLLTMHFLFSGGNPFQDDYTVALIFIPSMLIINAGFIDFFQQTAFRKWSRRIDVEISRMEQEIAALEESQDTR